jgi:hypothetical protein
MDTDEYIKNLSQQVLRTDASGMPLEWIDYRDAARLYYTNQVAYACGQPLYQIHGGFSAATGERSVIEVNSIIATIGHSTNHAERRNNYVPPVNNKTLFRRDANLCMYYAGESGWQRRLGQCCRRLPALQQPQRRAHARAGPHGTYRSAIYTHLRRIHLSQGPACTGRPNGIFAGALPTHESAAQTLKRTPRNRSPQTVLLS